MTEEYITLTDQDIDDLLDFVTENRLLPALTARKLAAVQKEMFASQLRTERRIKRAALPALKEQLRLYHYRSLIPAGESVGIIAAQSIGERQTQSTLSTFHKAGQSQAEVLTGVPRLQELITATKKPKTVMCRLHLRNQYLTIQAIRDDINHSLTHLTLRKLVLDYNIQEDGNPTWIHDWQRIMRGEAFVGHKLLHLYLDPNILYKYRLPTYKVAAAVRMVGARKVSFPPGGEAELVVVLAPEERTAAIGKILDMEICGLKGVREYYFMKEDGRPDGPWCIETSGASFTDMLIHPLFDYTRALCNDVWELYHHFGIEAARAFLIREMIGLMEGINVCHVKIIVEKMTFNGIIQALTRFTLRSDGLGPLSKATFEESVDCLVSGAIACELEPVKSVSTSVLCGKRACIGSGFMDMRIDLNKLI